MLPEDIAYYYSRAEVQLALAQKTELATAVAAHTAIAERYLELCEPARRQDVASRGPSPRLKPILA